MPDLAHARVHGLAIALGMAMAGSAVGNPQGPNVVHGTATFSSPSAGVLNITNSPQAIINWQAFGIDPGQITRFIQQNAGSAVLNRVVGADPSAILGSLYSNGRIFLVNPNGIVFGPNAVVDTAGLIASSLNMSNEDFLAGRMNFEGGPDAGSVINKGYIKAGRNGDVVLIAPQVENHGIIESDGGNLMLAAGEKVLITSIDNPEVTFEVQAPEHRALNMGQMIANGGAASVFAGSIIQAGQISANALEMGEGGRIMLVAKADVTLEAGSTTVADGGTGGVISVESREGTTWVRGEVSAQGSDGTGGDIRLLGDRVGVFDDAVVDASGEAGGGQVLVGGDYQGANPDVKNADHTAVGENATLRADAGDTGDGGKVIAWADGYTEMHGTISARGGDQAGDGGFVEISGKENLLLTGFADVYAPGGEAGTVLLDPKNITVDGGVGPVAGNNTFLIPTPGAIVTMGASVIAGLLQTGANVVLEANNDITINNAITVNPPPPVGHSLKLEAGRDVNINAAINMLGGDLEIIGNSANIDRDPVERDLLPTPEGDIVFLSGIGPIVNTGGGALTLLLEDGSPTNVGVIDFQSTTFVDTDGGDVLIRTADGGAVQFGSNTRLDATCPAPPCTKGGDIVIETNNLDLGPVVTTNPIVITQDLVAPPPPETAGNVTLRPATPGTTIGVAGGAGTLQINERALNNINVSSTVNGTIIIGDATAGKITVGDYDATSVTGRDIALKSAGGVEIETQIIGPIGTLTIEVDLDNSGAEELDLSTVADLSANLPGGTVQFSGGTDGNDTLRGNGEDNIWTINALNAGNLSRPSIPQLDFDRFGNLIGGAGDDTFVIVGAAGRATLIDGGLGTDEIDYSGAADFRDVVLTGPGSDNGFAGNETTMGAFDNINAVTAGGDPADELTADNVANNWTIRAGISDVVGGGRQLDFAGFEVARGGTADDDFAFDDGVLLFQVLGNGAATNDTVDLSAWTANTDFEVTGTDSFLVNTSMNVFGVGNIIGGTGSGPNLLDFSAVAGPVIVNLQADTATFISGVFLNFQDFQGTTAVDELIGTGNTSTWTVNAPSSGNTNDGVQYDFSSFENLTGGASGDDFDLNADVGGSVIGGAGPDTIDINAPQGVAGLDLVFEAEIITNSTANRITANQLTLDAGSLPDAMFTDVNQLLVNNLNGAVDITNAHITNPIGPTTLVGFSGGSPSNVTFSNDSDFVIAPGVNLQASGLVDISTSAGDISLAGGGAIDAGGSLILNAAGNIDMSGGGSIMTSGDFDLDAGTSVLLGTLSDDASAASVREITAGTSILNTLNDGSTNIFLEFPFPRVILTAPTIGTITEPIVIEGSFLLSGGSAGYGVQHIGTFSASNFNLSGPGGLLEAVGGTLGVFGGNDFGTNPILRADTVSVQDSLSVAGTLTIEASNELNIISDAEIGSVNMSATDMIIDAPIISVLANGNFVKLDASNSILINGDSFTVQGGDGFGDFASIDPVSLVLNLSGPLSVIAGAGDFATADLVADNISITAPLVTVQGGTGLSAQAHITALSGFLNLVADDVLITGGLGVSADAYIGAFGPLTITTTTCFDCTELAGEPPFDDGITEQGVFGSPVTINLPLPPVPPVPPPGGGTPPETPPVGEQLLQEVATRGTLQGLDGFPFPPSPFSPGRYPEKAPEDDGPGMCT